VAWQKIRQQKKDLEKAKKLSDNQLKLATFKNIQSDLTINLNLNYILLKTQII